MAKQYRQTGTKPMRYSAYGWVEVVEPKHDPELRITFKQAVAIGTMAVIAAFLLSSCSAQSQPDALSPVAVVILVCFFLLFCVLSLATLFGH